MDKQDLDNMQAALGRNVRMRREEKNLTLRRLGMMVGVDYTRLHAIEKGKGNATVRTLARIADGLEVSLSELFEGV